MCTLCEFNLHTGLRAYSIAYSNTSVMESELTWSIWLPWSDVMRPDKRFTPHQVRVIRSAGGLHDHPGSSLVRVCTVEYDIILSITVHLIGHTKVAWSNILLLLRI